MPETTLKMRVDDEKRGGKLGTGQSYCLPPQELIDLVDLPPNPTLSLSPDCKKVREALFWIGSWLDVDVDSAVDETTPISSNIGVCSTGSETSRYDPPCPLRTFKMLVTGVSDVFRAEGVRLDMR